MGDLVKPLTYLNLITEVRDLKAILREKHEDNDMLDKVNRRKIKALRRLEEIDKLLNKLLDKDLPDNGKVTKH